MRSSLGQFQFEAHAHVGVGEERSVLLLHRVNVRAVQDGAGFGNGVIAGIFLDALRVDPTPVLADLRQKAEAIRQRELERTLRYLPDLDPQTREHIQHLSHSLVNKLLHEPTLRLRAEAGNGHAAEYAEAVRHLFGLTSESSCSDLSQ